MGGNRSCRTPDCRDPGYRLPRVDGGGRHDGWVREGPEGHTGRGEEPRLYGDLSFFRFQDQSRGEKVPP